MLSVLVFLVLKYLLYSYLLPRLFVYSKVYHTKSAFTCYSLYLILRSRYCLSLSMQNRKRLFSWRFVSFSFDLFVSVWFGGVCDFVYLFGFISIFIDIFGVYVNESRFCADPLCLFSLLVELLSRRLIDLGDHSAMVHIFIGGASFVCIHLFIQNPIYQSIYYVITQPPSI